MNRRHPPRSSTGSQKMATTAAGKENRPSTTGPNSSPVIEPGDCMDRNTIICEMLEDYLGIHNRAVSEIKKQVTDPLKQVEALSKLSQALDRTFRALDKVTPELSPLAIARQVLEQQVTFVKERFPNHAPALLEVLRPFGRELAQTFGK